jgi:hypothetical protein
MIGMTAWNIGVDDHEKALNTMDSSWEMVVSL